MTEPLKCAECGVEIVTADADDLVRTDAGPVHRECFEGPVPPPSKADDFLDEFEPAEETMTPEEIEEEEEARRDHGDIPLPDDCFECHAEPSIDGGRGFLCRGRSML